MRVYLLWRKSLHNPFGVIESTCKHERHGLLDWRLCSSHCVGMQLVICIFRRQRSVSLHAGISTSDYVSSALEIWEIFGSEGHVGARVLKRRMKSNTGRQRRMWFRGAIEVEMMREGDTHGNLTTTSFL